MTKMLIDEGIRAEPAPRPREGTGGAPRLASVRLPADEGRAEQEESLVTDLRSGLTPSQMVDAKLAVLLGATQRPVGGAARGQQVRRTSGSREGTGPDHDACAAPEGMG